MKLTTILISVVTALASVEVVPVENPEPGISLPPDVPAKQFGQLDANKVPVSKLLRCLKKNKAYKLDWSKEDQGIFSITNLNAGCCHQAETLWQKYRKDLESLGRPVFLTPCTGLTVSNVSPSNMKKAKRLIPHA
ncbi:hypothetical protein VP1G_01876 [Cytospora mali]|uniref:Uncharacterized protein n=1 Tax=Cytospora mali TaxID=578113 RepID=A0A194USA9_CYTMA|nr:hypothetical protein VP1G_01876 [Valsa mali var. pyri (nom. inval.)]